MSMQPVDRVCALSNIPRDVLLNSAQETDSIRFKFEVRMDMNVTGINGMVVAIHAKNQFTGFNSMVYGSTYFNIQVSLRP